MTALPKDGAMWPDDCAREPIHQPGAIQPHGLLLALNAEDLTIEQASANCLDLLGLEVERLLGTPVLDWVPPEHRESAQRLVVEAAATFANPFALWLVGKPFDAIAHSIGGGVTILELEPSDSPGAVEGLDRYLGLVEGSLASFSEGDDLGCFAERMTAEIRRFTGFDRVMVYRFAPDFHGEVIGEAKVAEMESYLGLHYPASDIPAQARALYLKNRVRLLRDVDGGVAPLVPQLHPRLGVPLDLGGSVLRAMSPVHLQYLRNMEVAATLTISLVTGERLWGLIACHHRTPKFVPYGVRATAALYGVVMSAQIVEREQRLLEGRIAASRKAVLEVMTRIGTAPGVAASLAPLLPELAALFRADGGVTMSESEWFAWGSTAGEAEVREVVAKLRPGGESDWPGMWITADAAVDFPRLAGALPRAAGLVAIPVTDSAWLMFFRDESVRTLRWGGDPSGAKIRDAQGRLGPRASFAAWSETVRGQSLPWEETTGLIATEIKAASTQLLTNRNRLLETSNAELRRFAGVVAHEVKNQLQSGLMALSLVAQDDCEGIPPPLRAIAQAGADSLGTLGRFVTEMLHFARAQGDPPLEALDLTELAGEAVAQLRLTHDLEGVAISLMSLPRIHGHRGPMKHLLYNLLNNAVIHARNGPSPLAIRIGSRTERGGETVVYVVDDGRGIAASDQARIFDYFYRGDPSSRSGTGIGLGFCSQIVQRGGHRLWVESAEGCGATFCFTVTPVESGAVN